MRTWATLLALLIGQLRIQHVLAKTFLGGYDVVNYFTNNTASVGDGQFSHNFTSTDGLSDARFVTTFLFVDERNRDLFERDPNAYLPQWGGFCAYGVPWETMDAGGWPWDRTYMGPPGDGEVFTIHDGKLYIAFIPGAMEGFLEKVEEAVSLGDARWKEWWGRADNTVGPYNTDCLGPMDVWAAHSCTTTPQVVPGVPSTSIVSDECVGALEKYCGDASPTNDDVDIQSDVCDDCLEEHTQELIEGGCEDDGFGDLAQVTEKYFCK